MTPRERVLKALNFEEPDKIPVDFGGHKSSGIAAMAYAALKRELGITSGDIYVYDVIQQLAIVEETVLDIFGVDTIELGRAYMLNESDWKDWELPNGTPCKIPHMINMERDGDDCYLTNHEGLRLGIQKKGCLYFEQLTHPMQDRDFEARDFKDVIENFPNSMWCNTPGPGSHVALEGEGLLQMSEGARKLRESTDRLIIGIFGGNMFEIPQLMFRNDNYLLYTALYPEATLELSEILCDHYSKEMEKWLDAVGPYIDMMLFGDDFGSNHGPIIDPEMYRLYYKPFHQKMWSRAKEIAPHIKIQLHCCGSVEPFLEDMIEAGLDAINPVQISCRGMQLEDLKKKYGGRLTFWGGGCDTQSILGQGTPVEVESHVKKQLSIMKGSGGFVFQQVHNILGNVPPANIIKMFETVAKYR